MLNTEYPLVLGLMGGAATGKTVTANALAPMAQVEGGLNRDGSPIENQSLITWTHLYFALPLYRIARARQKIEGPDAWDRQLYEVHDALVDVFKGYITYEELVDTTYEICSMDCPKEGKPRTFLQVVGTDICRNFDPDCWVKWMDRKVKEEFILHEQEQDRLEEAHELSNPDEPFYRKALGVVISDCRFMNEAEWVSSHPNGVLVKFWARPEVIKDRLFSRDGVTLTADQASHKSEQEINDVPEEWFDAVIDTSDLTIRQQAQTTIDIVRNKFSA